MKKTTSTFGGRAALFSSAGLAAISLTIATPAFAQDQDAADEAAADESITEDTAESSTARSWSPVRALRDRRFLLPSP